MTENLMVPKIAGVVKIELVDGRWITGQLFLARFSEKHQGPEQVSDLLHQEGNFLPLRDETGEVRLLAKSSIIQLRMPRADGVKELDPAGLLGTVGKMHKARVALRTGEVLEGEFPVLPERARDIRLLDWLNAGAGCVPLLTAEMLVYLSQTAILWIEEME